MKEGRIIHQVLNETLITKHQGKRGRPRGEIREGLSGWEQEFLKEHRGSGITSKSTKQLIYEKLFWLCEGNYNLMSRYMKTNNLYPNSPRHFRRIIPHPPTRDLEKIKQELGTLDSAVIEKKLDEEIEKTWMRVKRIVHKPTQVPIQDSPN